MKRERDLKFLHFDGREKLVERGRWGLTDLIHFGEQLGACEGEEFIELSTTRSWEPSLCCYPRGIGKLVKHDWSLKCFNCELHEKWKTGRGGEGIDLIRLLLGINLEYAQVWDFVGFIFGGCQWHITAGFSTSLWWTRKTSMCLEMTLSMKKVPDWAHSSSVKRVDVKRLKLWVPRKKIMDSRFQTGACGKIVGITENFTSQIIWIHFNELRCSTNLTFFGDDSDLLRFSTIEVKEGSLLKFPLAFNEPVKHEWYLMLVGTKSVSGIVGNSGMLGIQVCLSKQ